MGDSRNSDLCGGRSSPDEHVRKSDEYSDMRDRITAFVFATFNLVKNSSVAY